MIKTILNSNKTMNQQDEQLFINKLFQVIQTEGDIIPLLSDVNLKYAKSVVIQYYLGYYYEKQGDIDEAQSQFQKCIKLNQDFTPPYFHIVTHLLQEHRPLEAYQTCQMIYCKKTIDAKSPGGMKVFNYKENIQLCAMLCDPLVKGGYCKEGALMYTTLLNHLERIPQEKMDGMMVGAYKNICKGLGDIFIRTDPEKSLSYYIQGLEHTQEDTYVDKLLVQGVLISKSYNMPSKYSKVSKRVESRLVKLFKCSEYTSIRHKITPEKIKVGYYSPDFNKNAVGLFLTPLLKHFDSTKFEVYCYYDNKFEDCYTKLFQSYPNINWRNIGTLSDEEVFITIKYKDGINILIDLIAHGVGGRIGLMSMAPAPVVVNYLGYPDSGKLPCYTHRITDTVADPESFTRSQNYTECLIRLKEVPFLCWTLFENEVEVPICDKGSDTFNIGVFNRDSKQSKYIRDIWKDLLLQNKSWVLCLKLGEGETEDTTTLKDLYKDIPKKQLKFLPFTETLRDYLTQFNEIDICLDTYPYSGTTTTCSSLYMGVPVVTLYNPRNDHVGNVTASILQHSRLVDFINVNEGSYKYKTKKHFSFVRKMNGVERVKYKQKVRKMFLESMDPIKFMKGYEESLLEISKDIVKSCEHDVKVV
jgi:predicted O-linked N-acetylglucosamine transferase (SPINDLY family)